MKHTLVLSQGTPLKEMKELFQNTPIARFTFDEANASVVCWDIHKSNGLTIEDNGCKHKLKKAGKAFKVTYEQAIKLFGATFTDQRGVKRIIPPWVGMKSSFMVLPS